MKLTKKSLVFIFLMIMAMVIGSFIAIQCSQTNSFLQFLSYSYAIGLENDNPMVLDLVIIKITLGFTLNISIAHGITIILAIISYPKIVKFVE
jgi:hypothetical protein